MAWSLLVHNKAASSNSGASVTSVAVDTTGCDFLAIWVSTYAATGAGTLSDSKSNTWSSLTAQTVSDIRGQWFYCQAPTVGSGHTFTVSGLTNYPSLEYLGFSGSVTSPFDQQNGAVATSSPISTGSVTPSANNELVLAGFSANEAFTSLAIGSGFTLSDSQAYSPGNAFGGGAAYLIQTSLGAVNPQWTFSSGTVTGVVAAIGTFQAGSVAARNPAIYKRIVQAVNRAGTY